MTADRLQDFVDEMRDIPTGDWQRYPNRERHGCTTVEAYVAHALAALSEGEPAA